MPTKLDELQEAIKNQLKKDNSNISETELTNRSLDIATTQFKKLQGKESVDIEIDEEKKFTEDGYEIISENTKIFLSGDITSIVE